MNRALAGILMDVHKWACILLCAYALILGGISLFGLAFNLLRFLSRKAKAFSFYYLLKTLMAATVAGAYYFLTQYRGFNAAFLAAETPKAVILMIVSLCLPMGLLMAIDHFLLDEPVRN